MFVPNILWQPRCPELTVLLMVSKVVGGSMVHDDALKYSEVVETKDRKKTSSELSQVLLMEICKSPSLKKIFGL